MFSLKGPVLTQILDNMMNKKLNQLDSDRSMYIYSAHDVTLVNVMRALNITDQTSRKPHYGATLAFELHFNERLNDLELRVSVVRNGHLPRATNFY